MLDRILHSTSDKDIGDRTCILSSYHTTRTQQGQRASIEPVERTHRGSERSRAGEADSSPSGPPPSPPDTSHGEPVVCSNCGSTATDDNRQRQQQVY